MIWPAAPPRATDETGAALLVWQQGATWWVFQVQGWQAGEEMRSVVGFAASESGAWEKARAALLEMRRGPGRANDPMFSPDPASPAETTATRGDLLRALAEAQASHARTLADLEWEIRLRRAAAAEAARWRALSEPVWDGRNALDLL